MNRDDLMLGAERARARQDAADFDAWLPFSGLDLELEHLETFVNANCAMAFEAFTEDNALHVLRDLAVNMLLSGLMVGQLRAERESLARRAA